VDAGAREELSYDVAPLPDGKAIMSFGQAREAALRLGRGETEQASAAAVVTLADAIEAYRADLTTRRAGIDNVTRLLFNLPAAMLKRPVGLLDLTELRKWRDAAVKRMAPASVNRLITILKAALNLAATRDERLSTRHWEIGLAALPEATTARNVVLPEATIRLLVRAAREQSAEFGLLVETLASAQSPIHLTPATTYYYRFADPNNPGDTSRVALRLGLAVPRSCD
jgi:hypothetical protein